MKTTELEGLHEAVAKVLADKVSEKGTYISDDGKEVHGYIASPAMLAQAIKFLKDNHVTAEVAVDTNLGRLEEALKHKEHKGRRLAQVSPIEAAKEA